MDKSPICMEEWRPVKGFEGDYQVSNLSRVMTLRRKRKGQILSTQLINSGYLVTYLYQPTSRSRNVIKLIHRLVAEAFIPNPENKRTVNHKDGNKLNNCATNLEWATSRENVRHSIDTGLAPDCRGTKSHFSILSEEDVHWIRAWLKCGFTQQQIAEAFGTKFQNISCIKLGKSWAWLK